jgi:taurine dioxygenase
MTLADDLKTSELKPGFGAKVHDIDLPSASDAEIDKVVAAFHRHGAVVIPGQDMTPDDLMRFIGRFGDPEDHTQTRFTLPGYPKIFILSNRVVDGKPIGAHNDGVGWHTDYSYKPEPVMLTMLYAVEVPDEGSDTLLADGCAAWNALSPEKQAELLPLSLHHSYKHFMATRQFGQQQTLSPELEAANPDVEHPLIRTHPADGRKALWPDRRTGRVHDRRRLRLPPQVGQGRSADVGQPLHPAHRHAVRRHQVLPDHASAVGQGRQALLAIMVVIPDVAKRRSGTDA